MQNFEYANPKTLKEALGLLGSQWGEADVLAGGTDLLSLMKEEVHTPKRVVNIKSIPELHGIKLAGGKLHIGPTTTVEELLSNAAARQHFPALIEAAKGITSPQIRNMGTVGGDLCQRPRCWYFRGGHGLLAQQDGKSLVEEGENKYHAIFSDGPAKFVSASSFGPALVALGATLKLQSASGSRDLPVEKFFVTPATTGAREIALLPNEILTGIEIPVAAGTHNATYEVRHKDALDWPLATASVALTMKGTTVSQARIVLGHVAPVPYVSPGAAEALQGKTLSAELAEAAGKAAVEGAKPLSANAYKIQLAKVAVKRALLAAGGLKS